MGFDVAYLKKEMKEPAVKEMTASERRHEATESALHERREHEAVERMKKMMRK